MAYTAAKLTETNLPTIIVNKYDLNEKYPDIGSGNEGEVYNYCNQYALKTFSFFRAMEYFYGEQLKNKFAKIEAMAPLKDESFCIPLGLFGYHDGYKEGCFTDLVLYKKGLKDFGDLKNIKNFEILLEYILKADAAMQRGHKQDLIIGDIKENNIMIDINNNPRYVDVDNYAYQEFGFNMPVARAQRSEKIYGHHASLKDNDIFLFATMSLKILTDNTDFNCFKDRETLNYLIEHLNISEETKQELRIIFSDAQNKPYIGPILQRIKTEQQEIMVLK